MLLLMTVLVLDTACGLNTPSCGRTPTQWSVNAKCGVKERSTEDTELQPAGGIIAGSSLYI